MKRLLAILMLVALLTALPVTASAADVSASEAADALAALGLLRGTTEGMELEREATRAEAVVMLLRLLGCETAAEKETAACPFDDGGWAARQLAYAARRGFVTGQSPTHFGSAERVGSRDFVTMLLRALGYSDARGDFSWQGSLAFADGIGLCHGEYTAQCEFLREDMVLLSYTALTLRLKDAGQTLAERLYREGVLSGAALRATRLSYLLPSEKPVYNAMEIHARCASAVFLTELYSDGKALQNERPDAYGSGFFITADGVAVMSYHELDGMEYAVAATLDGRRYAITGVLSYDPLWDVAVVRVSKTDLQGEQLRFFPYLDLGDSDETCTGETVYTISSALGMIDSITDGILSNRSRIADDPDYPCMQISAPISPGSSGGALMNRHGEVIGVIFGSYINGENMNLAVPINTIRNVNLTGEGTPLPEVTRVENEKKAAAKLFASETELVLDYGEETEIVITHTAPGRATLRYEIIGVGTVECRWGSFTSKHTVPLTVSAVGDGEAEIIVRFVDRGFSEEEELVIHVTVRGAPEGAFA